MYLSLFNQKNKLQRNSRLEIQASKRSILDLKAILSNLDTHNQSVDYPVSKVQIIRTVKEIQTKVNAVDKCIEKSEYMRNELSGNNSENNT